MIQATYRKKGIRITQVWYPDQTDLSNVKTDILFFHGVEKKDTEKNRIYTTFHTQMSDLTLTEEELLEKINASIEAMLADGTITDLAAKYAVSAE